MRNDVFVPNEVIRRAVEIVGGQSEMARLLDVKPPTVNQWVSGVRPVPPRRCPAIEKATGGVITRPELRPDDWQELWPELAQRVQRTRQRQAAKAR